MLLLVLNHLCRDSPAPGPWGPGWFQHSPAQGSACFWHIVRLIPCLPLAVVCEIANSPIYCHDDSLLSILLKSGNAFFSNATLSDPKNIEKPFKVEEAEPVNVTKPSPDKVMVHSKIRDSSIF